MIRNYIKSALVALFLSVSFSLFSQGNISINLGGNASSNPAILDLGDATNSHLGFLMPNVSLASSTDATTIPGPATGTLVWNTNSGMPFGVGFYYWSGTTWLYVNNSGLSSAISGTGTAGYIARWTAPSTLSTGVAQDNGTGVSISSTALTPANMLDVNGSAALGSYAGTAAPSNGVIVSGQVGMGTNTPNSSAALDVTSGSQGLLPPRMTATQMNAIPSPATGLIVLNSTTGCMEYYNGSAWQDITCPCTGAPGTPGTPSGPLTFCASSSGNVYTISPVAGATFYNWSLPAGATITSGNGTTSVTVTFGSSSGNVSVSASNSCGTGASASLAVTLTATPATPGAITGTTPICTFGQSGLTYSIAPVTGATSYTWSVNPAIGTITSGQGTTSITVTAAASAGTGNITVTASNICGTSAPSIYPAILTQTPGTPGAISGPASYCTYNLTGQTYSITPVANATSYTWTVPSAVGTITAGQGTNSITITTAATYGSGNITVTASNACGTSAASSKAVSVNSIPATPGAITGTTSYCGFSSAGHVYSIVAIGNATSYTWTVPPSVGTITAGQGTTSITITTAASAGTGNITVTATNTCGTSGAASLAVTVNNPTPATPGAITGTTNYCNQYSVSGNVYSIAPVLYATSYTWIVPAGVGTLNTGQGTTSITMTTAASYGTGNITVTATDACGTSAAQTLAVTVNGTPATPGTIAGTASPATSGTNTYSVVAVPGATTYTWSSSNTTLAAITSGQGTNVVGITTTATPGTYTICVTAGNTCGTSAASCKTVTSAGCSLTVSASTTTNETCNHGLTGVVTCTPAAGTPPYTYSWSSNPIQTTQTATALPGGTYTITVTDNSGCSRTASTTITQPTAVASIAVTFSLTADKAVFAGSTTGSGTTTYAWTAGSTTALSSHTVATVTLTTTSNLAQSYTLTTTSTTGGCAYAYVNAYAGLTGLLAGGTPSAGTIQSWTVPSGITKINLTMTGAQGGPTATYGGKGAEVAATFTTIVPGDAIKAIAGQQGGDDDGYAGGGGGGSFVWDASSTTLPLAAAGGGGGGEAILAQAGGGGSATTAPTVGVTSATGGSGGSGGSGGLSAGGCGWLSTGGGGTSCTGGIYPTAVSTPGYGGNSTSPYPSAGGFGGGGGDYESDYGNGAGGGGYNGGGGGNGNDTSGGTGGGGGSYVNPAAASQTITGSAQKGYGIITWVW